MTARFSLPAPGERQERVQVSQDFLPNTSDRFVSLITAMKPVLSIVVSPSFSFGHSFLIVR